MMVTKEECLEALRDIEFNLPISYINSEYGLFGRCAYVNQIEILNKLIHEHFDKETPVKPFSESKQDKLCPKCGAYLGFDALNDPLEEAPKYCSNCGQKIDWSDFKC